ncbi:hypothetical protein OAM67_01425 [bacterium]|nr:hypothetical protein [bacterium]
MEQLNPERAARLAEACKQKLNNLKPSAQLLHVTSHVADLSEKYMSLRRHMKITKNALRTFETRLKRIKHHIFWKLQAQKHADHERLREQRQQHSAKLEDLSEQITTVFQQLQDATTKRKTLQMQQKMNATITLIQAEFPDIMERVGSGQGGHDLSDFSDSLVHLVVQMQHVR